MALQLVRIAGELPDGFARLRRAAEAEGHRNMARLETEFDAGGERFNADGEALLAAYLDGELVGIGGITREPEAPDAALRMRRLYVLPEARRRGVASGIANALLQEALGYGRLITVRAGNAAAARFWETQDFRAVTGRAWTHELRG